MGFSGAGNHGNPWFSRLPDHIENGKPSPPGGGFLCRKTIKVRPGPSGLSEVRLAKINRTDLHLAGLRISIEQSTRIRRGGSKLLRSKMSPEPPVPGRGISFGRCGMTGRHGCASLGHPLRFRYRQAVYQAGSPAWSPYGMAMGRWNFVRPAGQPACVPYGTAMDCWFPAEQI